MELCPGPILFPEIGFKVTTNIGFCTRPNNTFSKFGQALLTCNFAFFNDFSQFCNL